MYWIRRLSELALLGWLGLLLLVDLAVAISAGGPQLLVPLCGAIGLVVVAVRRRHRVEGLLVLLVFSLGSSVLLSGTGADGVPGLTESGALLVLTVGVLRHVAPIRRAALLALAAMVVLLAEGVVRAAIPSSLGFAFVLFFGWGMAAGLGGYLRFQQERRNEAIHTVRRAERLELARELHDLVAHHITGIVVQAQAATVVAQARPEAVLPALEAIAGAGSEALTSMRRLVTVLRAEGEATRAGTTTLADLRILTERFAADGPHVTFEIGQGLHDGVLPPEVMTTLHRVLQESLTNIRRHAPATGWVQADLRPHESGVRLRVRNPGSAADPGISRLGGGFGLVGMTERVEALGGRLVAGTAPDGAWEVMAEFPLNGRWGAPTTTPGWASPPPR